MSGHRPGPGAGRFLRALDADGRALELEITDAWMLQNGIAELAGRGPLDSRIAAYELRLADVPPLVLPVALGHAEIMQRVAAAVRERFPDARAGRRGPRPTGPDVPWNAYSAILASLDDGDVPSWSEIVHVVAIGWLAEGSAPSQQAVAEELGYSEQSAFARAIRRVGWPETIGLAASLIVRWHERLLERVEAAGGPTLDEARLLRRLESLRASWGAETLS